MDISPPYDDLLDDDNLAPLKRNHACLQCKKRKVKCDATKPSCTQCLRSHAHAVRSAGRKNERPPMLVCTYADDSHSESPSASPPELVLHREQAKKKTGGRRANAMPPSLEREKIRRKEEEKDVLLAKIAPRTHTPIGRCPSVGSQLDGGWFPLGNEQLWVDHSDSNIRGTGVGTGRLDTIAYARHGLLELFPASTKLAEKSPHTSPTRPPVSYLSNLLQLIRSLSVHTFFQQGPQLPRMIHKASFLRKIALGPSHSDFPAPALLHAVCAAAAPYTAWVTRMSPEQLEEARQRYVKLGMDLETLDDFGAAQAESAIRAAHQSLMNCAMGPGQMLLEIAQAKIILGELFFARGQPMLGWLEGGDAVRLIKCLELHNVNTQHREKPGMLPDAKNDIEREERLNTLWLSVLIEATSCSASTWSSNWDLGEIVARLPTTALEYRKSEGPMALNPQSLASEDVLFVHPFIDSFNLVIKGEQALRLFDPAPIATSVASMIFHRVAQWLRKWHQRVLVPGDELEGLKDPEFQILDHDIIAFQQSVPPPLNNIMKFLEGVPASDSSLLCYYSTFFTVGRIIIKFTHHAMEHGDFGIAMKYSADLGTIQGILNRYGSRHALGMMISAFLSNLLAAQTNEQKAEAKCITAPAAITSRTFGDSRQTTDSSPNQTTPDEVNIYTNVNLEAEFGLPFDANPSGPEELSGLSGWRAAEWSVNTTDEWSSAVEGLAAGQSWQ
ncbi:hypothetical protein P7C73_g3436, partial [Tremellales sp. Uapishka_1]